MEQIKPKLDYKHWLTTNEKIISTSNWEHLHPELKSHITFFRDHLDCYHDFVEDLENGVLDKRIENSFLTSNKEVAIANLKKDRLVMCLMHYKFDNRFTSRETKLKDMKVILEAYNEQSELFKHKATFDGMIYKLLNADIKKPNELLSGGVLQHLKDYFNKADWEVLQVVSEIIKDLTANLGNPNYTIDKMLQFNTPSGRQPLSPYSIPPWVLKIITNIIEEDKTFNESAKEIRSAKETRMTITVNQMENIFKYYKWYALNHYLYNRVIDKRNVLSDSEIDVVLREGKSDNSVHWGIRLPKKLETDWSTDENVLMAKVNSHFLGVTPMSVSAKASRESDN